MERLEITASKKNQFASKGIYTVQDLVDYIPRRYDDFSRLTGLRPKAEGKSVVTARIEMVKAYPNSVKLVMATCRLDSGEKLLVQWFRQPWIYKRICPLAGQTVLVAGNAEYSEEYRNWHIAMPEIFTTDIENSMRVYPHYRKIPNMSMGYLTGKIHEALALPDAWEETVPEDILKKYGLPRRKEALVKLHCPATIEDTEVGKERMLFDDLLYFALKMEWGRRFSAVGSPYYIRTFKSYNAILESLPYSLTDDQKKAIISMTDTIRSGKRLNALLQGDVGCGKSICAFIMMALMADSGYQSVIMAPTQVLASQHYEDLVKLMTPLGYKVAYLGGTMKAPEKRFLLEQIAHGDIHMVVGTHAVIGKSVSYKKLAMCIVDEEHRFGVAQRKALTEKAGDGVHTVTMSATPIPRSLASVIYGDSLQLITITTMPAERKPVLTKIATDRAKIYSYIATHKLRGEQAYVVCPMIDKNEEMADVRSVEELEKEYREALEPRGVRVGTLTGRDSKEVTDKTLTDFRNGDIDVLIATTVVEVGVNVPTATLMVIENAERFGLSGLHQLRGRVGRGSVQSFCALIAGSVTEEGTRRLQAMERTNSGFEIAREDLAIRGAGDFLGTAQHGDNRYVSLMLAYPDKYQEAKKIAAELLDRGDDCCGMVRRVVAETEEE